MIFDNYPPETYIDVFYLSFKGHLTINCASFPSILVIFFN